jgi:DNA-binding transcriptional LysR family regulator
MNLKQLAHIAALSDTLCFCKAAERVCLSQSALSKSIASLEAELGIRIFERTTNSVSIAPAGQFVIDHAKHLLSEASNFSKSIDYLKTGMLGSASIGSGPFPAACFLNASVREFHQHYPRVSLNLRVDHWKNLLAELKHGQIDFFIADVRSIDDDPMLDLTPIGGITVGLFCDHEHPLAVRNRRHKIKPREILDFTFASVSLPALVFHELKQSIGLGHNDTFQASIECDNIALIKDLIPGSDIIFVGSNRMMDDLIRSGTVTKLDIPMSRNRFGEWALVKVRNRTLAPSAGILAQMVVDSVRTGSKADDDLYGFKGNKPLNFL